MNSSSLHQPSYFDLDWVQNLAREAGQMALQHFGRTTNTIKPDKTIVTEADKAIETFLVEQLSQRYPEDGVLGEEGTSTRRDARRQWVLDPIDGTAAFSVGYPSWCVSIGMLEDGIPRAGVVYLPVSDDMFAVDLTGPATFNGEAIQVMSYEPFDNNSGMLCSGDIHSHWQIDFPGKVRALGSLAIHICYVAKGSAVASINSYSSLWDVAAALPILERAGGTTTLLDGSPLPFAAALDGSKFPQPIVSAPLAYLDDIRSRLRFRPGE
ncbi:MAG TPA: inositol monophosphatase [Caldilineae bacterium]|nr:inositol monophosphatase [Caldilineae bacterium]